MKILIVSSYKKKGIKNAFTLRTEQFLTALKKHKICLVNISDEEIKKKIPKRFSALTEFVLNKEAKNIHKIAKAFQSDLIIGVNTHPSYIASKIAGKMPFWADLNGWIMAELQAQSVSQNTNAFIPYGGEIEKTILKKADKISVVSTPQKYAVLGELSFLGRLNKQNFHHNFVETIPNSVKTKKRLKINAKKTFNIIQIGGFNAWFDEKTLFMALEKAMRKNPNIHFTSTGGTIEGVDEKSYPRFLKRVEKSKFKNNFHLLGWVKNSEISKIYSQANCLINVDFDCTETLTGARNRLTEGLSYSLPIITTKGSEIANEIIANEAGLGSENNDIKSLSENILTLSKKPALQKKLAQNAEKLLKERYSAKMCMNSLTSWLKNPQKAPSKGILMQNNLLKTAKEYLKNRGTKAFIKKVWQKIH